MSVSSLAVALPMSEHLGLREAERHRRACLAVATSPGLAQIGPCNRVSASPTASAGVLIGGHFFLATQIGSGVFCQIQCVSRLYGGFEQSGDTCPPLSSPPSSLVQVVVLLLRGNGCFRWRVVSHSVWNQ